jgi:hypothetical protein
MDRQDETAPDVRFDLIDENSDLRLLRTLPDEQVWWRIAESSPEI